MPISKDQPMRPYLDDIGDAIGSLDSRVTALEQGGHGNVYGILHVANLEYDSVVSKGDIFLTPGEQVDGIEKYAIPEGGTWNVEWPSEAATLPVTFNSYLDYQYIENVDSVNGLRFSTSNLDSATWRDRTIQRTLQDGRLVFAIAKSNGNSGSYMCPAFFTMHDYGPVSNVLSGFYNQKQTYELVNPSDPSDIITMYGYGAYGGGYNGVVDFSFLVNNVVEWSNSSDNIDFYAPFKQNDMEAYENSPYKKKLQFFYMVKATEVDQ